MSSEYTAIKQKWADKRRWWNVWIAECWNKFISLFYNALSLVTGVAEWRGHHVEELLKAHFSLRKFALFRLKCSPLLNCLCNTLLSLTGHDSGCKPIKQILQEAAVQTRGTWDLGEEMHIYLHSHAWRAWGAEPLAQFKDLSTRLYLPHSLPLLRVQGKSQSNLNSNDSTGKKRKVNQSWAVVLKM